MKIKSINDFTLAECQEYLDANPNGEFAQEVVQRMEYLRQLKDRKLQQDRVRWINEFNKEFNRYYATQRYEDAFAICLKYINNVGDKSVVLEKANSVIHKLKDCIHLPSSVSISYDWLIDQLLLNGYDKMKYDGNSLKWQKSIVELSNSNNTTRIATKCRINLFYRILAVPVLFFLTAFIFSVILFPIGEELVFDRIFNAYECDYESWDAFPVMVLISVIPAIRFFYWWVSAYIKAYKAPQELLHNIAKITINYFTR